MTLTLLNGILINTINIFNTQQFKIAAITISYDTIGNASNYFNGICAQVVFLWPKKNR